MKARFIRLHHKVLERLIRLKKEADEAGEYRVAKRIHATIMNHDGKSSGEISRILRSPRSRVSEWLRNYECHGYESLLEGHRSGRPGGLGDGQLLQLSGIIESGPVSYGYLSGVWTSVMIKEVIQEEFRILYTPRHVRRILDDLDFSVQSPKRILTKADPLKQNRWRRYTYPLIKKKPAKNNRH